MRTIKPASREDVQAVRRGLELLKQARDLFVAANAPNTADKVRAAIISADGAQRHVQHRLARTLVAEARRMRSSHTQ